MSKLLNSLSFKIIRRHFSSQQNYYDIVVSGGGMVGFFAACSLGSNKWLEDRKILILEKNQNKKWLLSDEYSNRVSALNKNAVNQFRSLNIWKNIEAMRAKPVKNMQVWESNSEARIVFNDNNNDIAYIVENDVTLEAIKQELPSNIEVHFDSEVQAYYLPTSLEEKVKISLKNGLNLECDLLVGADGANSLVRKCMNVLYLNWKYDQAAIVATLLLSELSDDRSSLVWSTTHEKAAELMKKSEEEFIYTLNQVLWENEYLSSVQSLHGTWNSILDVVFPGHRPAYQLPPNVSRLLTPRASFPLGLGHSTHYVSNRVVLIGDAAHKIHPLAGQGVNLGFGDVDALVCALQTAVQSGCDIGNVEMLFSYEKQRLKHNVVTLGVVDSLYRLYTCSILPVVLLRSLGLSTFNAVEFLRKNAMAHAAS